MPRNCINKANNFSYICGEIAFSWQKRSITAVVRKDTTCILDAKLAIRSLTYTLNNSATNLQQWLDGKRKCVFSVMSMVCREPTDHTSNCYFCMTPPVIKACQERSKIFSILIFQQQLVRCHMENYFPCLGHLNDLHSIRTMKNLLSSVMMDCQCRRNDMLHRVFHRKHILSLKMNCTALSGTCATQN